MSVDASRIQLKDLFEVDLNALKVDTAIPFDCYVYLKHTNRIFLWLFTGEVFTAERKEKLLKLADSNLYALKDHQKMVHQYLGGESDAQTVSGALDKGDIPSRTGAVSISKSDSIVVSGSGSVSISENSLISSPVKSSSDLIIIGGKNRRPPGFMILNGKAAAEEKNTVASLPAPKVRSKVDAEFINTVITATVEVFASDFSVNIKAKPPARRHAGAKGSLQIDIASFVGLTSQGIRGTIGLCFPTETYLYLLNELTGRKYHQVLPEYCVGCAEFMYTIYEHARPQLIELGYNIDQALPIIVSGRNISVPSIIPDKGFSMVFESAGGPFQFEVGIKTGL